MQKKLPPQYETNSFFVENEKNSRDLLLILGVPTPKFRGTYLEGGGVTKG